MPPLAGPVLEGSCVVGSWTDTLRRPWQTAHCNSYARSSDKATICSLHPDLIVKKNKQQNMDLRRWGINVKIQRAERHVITGRAQSVGEFMHFSPGLWSVCVSVGD